MLKRHASALSQTPPIPTATPLTLRPRLLHTLHQHRPGSCGSQEPFADTDTKGGSASETRSQLGPLNNRGLSLPGTPPSSGGSSLAHPLQLPCELGTGGLRARATPAPAPSSPFAAAPGWGAMPTYERSNWGAQQQQQQLQQQQLQQTQPAQPWPAGALFQQSYSHQQLLPTASPRAKRSTNPFDEIEM